MRRMIGRIDNPAMNPIASNTGVATNARSIHCLFNK